MKNSIHRALRACGFVVCALLTTPPGVFAQAQQPPSHLPSAPGQRDPNEPGRQQSAVYRGAQPPLRDIVGVSASLFGAHDDELTADNPGGIRGLAGTGPFAGLEAGIAITPDFTGKFDFDAEAMTGVRWYQRASEFVPASQGGAATATYHFTRRTMIQGRGGATYTPYFDFTTIADFDPEAPLGPDRIRDYSNARRRTLTYDGGAELTHTRGENTSFTLFYSAQKTQLLNEAQTSLDTTLSATYWHRLNRRTATRVTYVHRDGDFHVGQRLLSVRVDDLGIVLDRDWTRSSTRRTTFSFSLGPSLVDYDSRQLVRAFGGAAITHPFNRSWSIRGSYRRGVNFLESTPQPMLSDSMLLALSGLLTRRLDVSVSGGAVLGEVGLEGDGSRYDSYTAGARMRYALNSTFALYGEYLYNFAEYGGTAAAPAIPGQDRHGVRVGLTLYVPLLQERARPEPRSGGRIR